MDSEIGCLWKKRAGGGNFKFPKVSFYTAFKSWKKRKATIDTMNREIVNLIGSLIIVYQIVYEIPAG